MVLQEQLRRTVISTDSENIHLLTISAYANNTFRFAAADPGIPTSITKGKEITVSTPVSKDGGQKWTVDLITIPESSYGKAAKTPKSGGS